MNPMGQPELDSIISHVESQYNEVNDNIRHIKDKDFPNFQLFLQYKENLRGQAQAYQNVLLSLRCLALNNLVKTL
jgi:hypothetical protein